MLFSGIKRKLNKKLFSELSQAVTVGYFESGNSRMSLNTVKWQFRNAGLGLLTLDQKGLTR